MANSIGSPQPQVICTYVGSWPQNIGNAFFDLGAEATLQHAFPTAKISRTGGACHWMFNNPRRRLDFRMMRALWQRSSPKFGRGNSIEIGEFINADLFVFAGMSVCKEFVENNGRTLVAAHQNGIPIVGLGVGASRYTREDLTPFIKMCREIRNICLITRDELTYSALVSELPNVKRGIDSAFFLPWGFKPTPLNLPKFVVKSFDNMAEPEIHTDLDVIRAHHDLWGPLPRKYVELRRCLVSDVPEDYLNLYSAAEITYSDRVHACVAALAFGNSAQLFGQTPRAQLFAEIGVADISTRPTMADTTLLNDLRVRQINLLKDSYREMVTE